MLFVRSFLYWLVLTISTMLFSILLIPLYLMPFYVRIRMDKAWIHINLSALKYLCKLDYEVEGLENLPEKNAIFLAKHQSAWETIAFQAFLPPLSWILKQELLRIPFFGWGLACMEPVAINRKAGRQALSHMIKQGSTRLQQGRWLMIFPEGTRTAPGKKAIYHPGAGLLAQKTQSPIIPIAHNAGLYWPRRGFIKYPGIIKVVIGPCMDTSGMKAKEIVKMAEEWIEDKVAEIS